MTDESTKGEESSARADELRDKARALFADWREWLSGGLDQVETFTKEKPAAGLALSFVAGFLLSLLLRRKS